MTNLSGEKPTSRVSGDDLQALLLRELAIGEKSRAYLDTVANDELGASANSVYQTGLIPLRDAGQVKARRAGLDDGWYWRLTEEPI